MQRRVERRDGRPVAREDPFDVPDTIEGLRDALVRFIHPLVDSAREDVLVNETNLRVIWAGLQAHAGQTINLHIEFDWGENRIESIRVYIPGETITITPGAPPTRSERPEAPTPQAIEGVEESVGDIQHEAGTSARNPIDRVIDGGSRALGIGAGAVRIGGMAAAHAGVELGASIAGAVISSFNMAWSVFTIFTEIHGERAAGMGTVDYAGMLAAWILNDQGASTHADAMEYAEAMESHNGEGEPYRMAAAAARRHAGEAWGRIQANTEELERLRAGYAGQTQALHDALIDQIRPHIENTRVRIAYLSAYHNCWRERHNFFIR